MGPALAGMFHVDTVVGTSISGFWTIQEFRNNTVLSLLSDTQAFVTLKIEKEMANLRGRKKKEENVFFHFQQVLNTKDKDL